MSYWNRIILVIMIGSVVQGCSFQTVKPWQKQYLAKRTMTLPHAKSKQKLMSHIYFSKEGSSGGSHSDAGGCGCN